MTEVANNVNKHHIHIVYYDESDIYGYEDQEAMCLYCQNTIPIRKDAPESLAYALGWFMENHCERNFNKTGFGKNTARLVE